jgi:hypothetical protein
MSILEDQPDGKTPRGSGGNLQSKDITEPDMEANDSRNEPQQPPALDAAADQSSQ